MTEVPVVVFVDLHYVHEHGANVSCCLAWASHTLASLLGVCAVSYGFFCSYITINYAVATSY